LTACSRTAVRLVRTKARDAPVRSLQNYGRVASNRETSCQTLASR
jgi:hypothetical protein